MAAKKYKPMTKREKQLSKEVREHLREKGIIPPPKQKLNRKKYIAKAKEQWEKKSPEPFYYLHYLEAISYMLGHYDSKFKLSLEAVGAAKVLLLTIRLSEFSEKLKNEGRYQYSIQEQLDFIKDILEA